MLDWVINNYIYNLWGCVCEGVYVRVCVWVCECTSVCVSVRACVWVYERVCECTSVCVSVRACVWVYERVCVSVRACVCECTSMCVWETNNVVISWTRVIHLHISQQKVQIFSLKKYTGYFRQTNTCSINKARLVLYPRNRKASKGPARSRRLLP